MKDRIKRWICGEEGGRLKPKATIEWRAAFKRYRCLLQFGDHTFAAVWFSRVEREGQNVACFNADGYTGILFGNDMDISISEKEGTEE